MMYESSHQSRSQLTQAWETKSIKTTKSTQIGGKSPDSQFRTSTVGSERSEITPG